MTRGPRPLEVPVNRDLLDAMVSYLADHANDRWPKPEVLLQAVLFAPREGKRRPRRLNRSGIGEELR
jgi:hypothetical protein